jgi:hypothetical protein
MLQTRQLKCGYEIFALAGISILSAETKPVITTLLEQVAELRYSIMSGD